ncbi:MAG TPA: MBOAT family protein [Casimicrobiaceae bacterium]|nr:MBOAT family protein [Casimicrobiaceae bacterium]
MVFASPLFLFLFLPATIVAYFALPRRWRNGVLLVASLVFYAWGEARYVPLILASVAFNWSMGLAIAHATDLRVRKRRLTAAVTGNLATLAVFKYANFAAANVDAIAPVFGLAPVALAAIPLPLGISFFTFHAISYVVDVYKRTASAQRDAREFALYILLFPQLIAGPIIRYRDIAAQLGSHPASPNDFAYGVRRLVVGLGKKLLIANTLGATADAIFGLPGHELAAPVAWLGIACYTLQIYFDFSGYSDMAIGLMRMFGFHILENFDYPYIASSIREFWRRWHISLSNWFRDYLYIPLGGNRRGAARAYANLVIVFLLCGLWHGASWPFVVWGAWHGAFLVAERAGLDRPLTRHPVLAHAYALAAVMGGWVLFRCDTLAHAGAFYRALLGFSTADPALHPLGEFVNPLLVVAFACGVLFSMPIAPWMSRRMQPFASRPIAGALVLTVDGVAMTLLCVAAAAMLAAGTYNPFIYFRF